MLDLRCYLVTGPGNTPEVAAAAACSARGRSSA